MAEPSKESQSRIKEIYHWISEAFNLWGLLAATGIGGIVAKMLPYNWQTPIPWLFTIFSMAAALALLRIGNNVVDAVKRHRNRVSFTLIGHGGEEGTITIMHNGYSTEYSVSCRIVKTLDGSTNPAPQLFQCYLAKDGISNWAKILKHAEWTQISIAAIGHNDWDGNEWLTIFRGQHGNTVVPDKGVVLEVNVCAGKQRQMQCFKISRPDFITVTEIK